ncbi:hypothetical protein IWX50DRAFT_447655 [Phyllosticta citricarpa]
MEAPTPATGPTPTNAPEQGSAEEFEDHCLNNVYLKTRDKTRRLSKLPDPVREAFEERIRSYFCDNAAVARIWRFFGDPEKNFACLYTSCVSRKAKKEVKKEAHDAPKLASSACASAEVGAFTFCRESKRRMKTIRGRKSDFGPTRTNSTKNNEQQTPCQPKNPAHTKRNPKSPSERPGHQETPVSHEQLYTATTSQPARLCCRPSSCRAFPRAFALATRGPCG